MCIYTYKGSFLVFVANHVTAVAAATVAAVVVIAIFTPQLFRK